MTIEYLDSRRISGLSSDTKPTNVETNSIFIETDTPYRKWFDGSDWLPNLQILQENFTDDQTTLDARWTQAGTKTAPSASNNNFTWSGYRETTNHAMSWAAGVPVSDTAWVARFKITPVNLSPGTYSSYFGWGLRSISATSDSKSTGDSIMASIKTRSATPGGNDWYLEADDGTPWANPQMGANEFSNKPTTGTKGYEMKRLTSTTMSLEIFNSTFTSSTETSGSVSCPSTVVNLQHVTFQNDNASSTGGSFDGTGDYVYFYDGVTTFP